MRLGSCRSIIEVIYSSCSVKELTDCYQQVAMRMRLLSSRVRKAMRLVVDTVSELVIVENPNPISTV